MGAAAGDGQLFSLKRAVPVAGVDDGLVCSRATDLATRSQPASELPVDLFFYQRQIRQQCLTVDSLLSQAFADAVLLPGAQRFDPRALDGEAVEVGLIQCIALAHLLAPVRDECPVEGQRHQMAAAVTQT